MSTPVAPTRPPPTGDCSRRVRGRSTSPGLSPNFLNLNPGNALAFNPGTLLNGGTLVNSTTGNSFPNPGGAAGISDFVKGSWKNNRAPLGPLDLNRPLADYRLPLPVSAITSAIEKNTTVTIILSTPLTGLSVGQSVAISGITPSGYDGTFVVTAVNAGYTQFTYTAPAGMAVGTLSNATATLLVPLSPTNMAPANVTFGSVQTQQAVIDRQLFAMSIFVRLAVASGADASYQLVTINGANGPGTYESISFPNGVPGVNTPSFKALRALAQLAANIVDYIDSDDISTAFVWNP